jgi:hypothetical protein
MKTSFHTVSNWSLIGILIRNSIYDSLNKSPYFPDSINWMVSVVGKKYFLCEEQPEFLNVF